MLEGLCDVDGKLIVFGIFVVVFYCIDLIGGLYVEIDVVVVVVFWLKSVWC